MATTDFGSVERWLDVQGGRANRSEPIKLPILNPEVPFIHLAGGASAVAAGGDLELDLTQAQLLFPDGRSSGEAHIQFMMGNAISVRAEGYAMPHWVFATQPGGIQVEAAHEA